MKARLLLLPLLALALGCGGLFSEEPEPEPMEPFPLVLPGWIMGRWQRVVEVDGRRVVELGCDGLIQTLEIADEGRISLALGGARSQVTGTELQLNDDGSVAVLLEQGGRLELSEDDEHVLEVASATLGLSEPVLFAGTTDSVLERLLAPVDQCGSSALDLSGLDTLTDDRYAAPGVPCSAPGLQLWLDRSKPALRRAGLDFRVVAARPVDEGTWLTVLDDQGRHHGMRLDPLPDGSVRIWQRTSRGMSSELLQPASGRCR